MADKKIGFIGCGNMGSSMISGIISSGLCDKERLIASAHSQATLDRLSEAYGIRVTLHNAEVIQNSDLVFLAVKPYQFQTVIEEIREFTDSEKLIVSIAAGISLAKLNELFAKPVKLIRAMPNTPAQVLEAMSALTPNEHVSPEELQFVKTVFKSFGKAEVVPETLMNAVIGVSGSSPAYVYLFIEAMADAAVADGMPRTQAYKFAAQAVYGAAKMVLETGTHPAKLKDAVCSPAGTTIAAVAKLEECGMRNAVIQAQRCCTETARKMDAK